MKKKIAIREGDTVFRPVCDGDTKERMGIAREIYRSNFPGMRGMRVRVEEIDGSIGDFFADSFRTVRG